MYLSSGSDVCSFQPDNLLASVLAHPILTASGLQGRDHRFIPPSSAASAAASVLASLSTSQYTHPSRGRSHGLLPSSVHPESTMYRSDRTVMDRCSSDITFTIALFTSCRFIHVWWNWLHAKISAWINMFFMFFSVCLTVILAFGAMHCTQSSPQQRWAYMPSTCMR